jgi:tyrosyl-tRNA synthetase
MTTGYIGFDPTSDSLHIGSLVPIILLVHLQRAGHKPIALIGGATGMVGDPSGKSEERVLLGEDDLRQNQLGIQRQLEKYLDFAASKQNAAEMVNNYDWFKEITFLHFIRDIGKHVTVNYMMAKESVRKRIEGDSGISFTEFSYQLIQGYDFYWLYENKNCSLQMGGSDQWGNITTGAELIRRKSGGEAIGFTCPLITKSDGGKFGKTEQGNIWLDPLKTSPFQFYQFWLNASDADAEKWIKIFTFLPKDEIDKIIAKQQGEPSSREVQKNLAKEVTVFVHGEEEYQKAIQTTQKLFADATAPAETLTVHDLESMEGVVRFDFASEKFRNGTDVVTFLAESGIFPSKGEARKMVLNGGVSINRNKVEDVTMPLDETLLLHKKYLLVQKGKKNYFLVKIF